MREPKQTYDRAWNPHVKRLVGNIFAVVLFLGVGYGGYYLVVDATTPSPVEAPVEVPTRADLEAQLEGDIPLLVDGRNVLANKQLDEFQLQYPTCLWVTQSGIESSARAAGAVIGAQTEAVRINAPNGEPVVAIATLALKAPEKGRRPPVAWFILAASC